MKLIGKTLHWETEEPIDVYECEYCSERSIFPEYLENHEKKCGKDKRKFVEDYHREEFEAGLL